jgi:hypothetical protein
MNAAHTTLRTAASATTHLKAFAIRYAQTALGVSFLSAVADRFGLLGRFGGWGNFASFTAYTAKVLSFMPGSSIPFFAWTGTMLETAFGFGLVIAAFLPSRMTRRSQWPRWIALGSSVLLFLFAAAMAVGLEWKKPLDYLSSGLRWRLLLAISRQRTINRNYERQPMEDSCNR